MNAKVYISLKSGVHDPQGEAVLYALKGMGYKEVGGVRVGKCLEVKLPDMDRDLAEVRLSEMCEKLLANTIIESYRIECEE